MKINNTIPLHKSFFDSPDNAIFSISAVAKALGKSPNTIKNWISKGLISYQTFGDGSKPKLRKKQVMEFLDRNEVKAVLPDKFSSLKSSKIKKQPNQVVRSKSQSTLQLKSDLDDFTLDMVKESLSPEMREILEGGSHA